jgi:type III pantothenate kinase
MADILAIDIGNSRTHLGHFTDGEGPSDIWVVPTGDRGALHEVTAKLTGLTLDAVVIESVRPESTGIVEHWAKQDLDLTATVLTAANTPVENRATRPQDVGLDRLVNSLAAWHRVQEPCIVVDFGTAVTFDIVGENGAFEGGVILPGAAMFMRILAETCAQLPELHPERPASAIGRDTREAMNSGTWYGLLGAIRGVLEGLQEEVGERRTVLVTGGDATFFTENLDFADEHIPHLTLQGIALAWEHGNA